MVAFDITILTSNLLNILLIAISGTLICVAVHFIPVGGAPAAMAQATGIGTGTVELAAGSGLVGLLTASHLYTNEPNASMALVLAAGAMGSMIMMASAGVMIAAMPIRLVVIAPVDTARKSSLFCFSSGPRHALKGCAIARVPTQNTASITPLSKTREMKSENT